MQELFGLAIQQLPAVIEGKRDMLVDVGCVEARDFLPCTKTTDILNF